MNKVLYGQSLIFLLITFFLSSAYSSESLEWINNPYKLCMRKKQICAVGSAPGRIRAELNAKANIARFFEETIESTETHKTNSLSSTVNDEERDLSGVESEKTEISNISVQSKIKNVLSGIEIVKCVNKDLDVYCLASLDRQKTSTLFHKKITQLDEKITRYLKRSKTLPYKRVKNLFDQIERYQEFLITLNGSKVKTRNSRTDLESHKKKYGMKDPTVYLSFKAEEIPSLYVKKIQALLLEDGYLPTTEQKSYNWKIVIKMDVEEQFLKVPGFKKHRFLLSIQAQNFKDETKSSWLLESIESGREFKQIEEQAIQNLIKKTQLKWKTNSLLPIL